MAPAERSTGAAPRALRRRRATRPSGARGRASRRGPCRQTESPVSRILSDCSVVIICLGRPLPERLAATDPGVLARRATPLPLYAVLLQVGFTEPAPSPGPLVRSYRTVSPLPAARVAARPLAVCSLLHFPWARAPWELPSTLPCGVRTFL